MPIRSGKYDDFGKSRGYVEVDLADAKHKNRVITFLKRKNPATGKVYYEINAKWTKQLHPSMHLTKSELKELVFALTELAKISPSRAIKK